MAAGADLLRVVLRRPADRRPARHDQRAAHRAARRQGGADRGGGFGPWLAAAALVDGNNLVRLAGSVTGSLAWLVLIAFQPGPFRTYLYGDGEAASLILPGIVTAAGLAILQAAIILVAVR